MAIISNFEKCIHSPYLFEDSAASARVEPLLSQASERLVAARRLLDTGGDAGDLALLAYECMFATLRALVYARGYREAGLRCLLAAAEQFYVRESQLPLSHLRDFQLAQSLRLSPVEALAAATSFLEVSLPILRKEAVVPSRA